MGVECTAYLCIGTYAEDAEQYLIEHGLLQVGELEDKYGGDIELVDHLEVKPASRYSDSGYYVGFFVYKGEVKDFATEVVASANIFKALTGEEATVNLFEHWH
jgi:hypothetical protein